MKLFNTIATLGALCAVSEAISIRANQKKINSQTEFTLTKLDNLNKKMDVLKNLDIKGLNAAGQEAMGEKLMKKSKFQHKFEGNGLAQQEDDSWWGWWWPAAVTDSAVDLVVEVTSDAFNWSREANESYEGLKQEVVDDVEEILADAQQDLAEWPIHIYQGDMDGIADDVKGWIGDLRTHVEIWGRSAGSEALELVNLVADDVIDWVDDIAHDLESIINGSYCLGDSDPKCQVAEGEFDPAALNASLP